MSAIVYETKGRIAYITINRPEALNALTLKMWDDLLAAWIRFRDDPGVWTAIVTGTGNKAFSAGADLVEASKLRVEATRKGLAFIPPIPSVSVAQGTEMWKPVIAAINGLAVGGGLEIALACDIRIAAEHAQMGLSEVKFGVIPAMGGTQRLTRFLPFGVALQMLLTGDAVSAREAHRVGLVNTVVPFADLMPTAESLAVRINQNAPLAVRMAKEVAYRGRQMHLEDALRLEKLAAQMVVNTEDSQEGINAFANKRTPDYRVR